MLRVKRKARGSNEQQENRKRVKEASSTFSDLKDTVEGMKRKLCWKEPSQEIAAKFIPSIVSLASLDGGKLHSKSTGIVVENSLGNTSILTSSALVSSSEQHGFIDRLKVKVRLPDNQVVDGWIQHHDLPFSMVLVITRYSPDLRAVCFSNTVLVQRHTDLLALKCCFESGKLMQTHGVPSDDPSNIDSKGSMLSTCKITMDGSGGPLVDLDGNIVGMNHYHDQEGTPYVQGNEIDKCLRALRIRWDKMQRHCWQKISSPFRRHLEALEFTKDVPAPKRIDYGHKRTLSLWPTHGIAKVMNDRWNKDGYPLPIYADGGMHLEGHFEEEFGRDIWSEPARKIALKMSRSVVALASFKDDGKKRHFACTGVCIGFNRSTSTTKVLTSASLIRTSGAENKLVDNLEIRACLPSKECVLKGELENYDFYYNVAVISFEFLCNRPAMLVDAPQTEVIALGRIFKSGNSMATEGSVTRKKCKFGCKKELKISTCKITKAGIGGPLLDFKGNVVGMNFYDTEGTPYLPSKIILKVLGSFNAEWLTDAGITSEPNTRPQKKKPNTRPQRKKPNTSPEKKKPTSWPVPKPYWYYPNEPCHRPEIEPKFTFSYRLL